MSTGASALAVKLRDDSRMAEVADIFGRHQRESARSQQTALGPSEAGHPCDRHLVYRTAGIPAVNPEALAWAALIGTWAHEGAAQAMRDDNTRTEHARFLVENHVDIEPGILPGGHTDVYDTVNNEVWDWKFVGQSSMDKYRSKGAPRHYLVQAMLYGLGWTRAGYKVDAVRIFFLPRWSNDIGDGFDWCVEYNELIALNALRRLRTIQAQKNLVLGGLARWDDLPEDTSECRFCPWLRRAQTDQARADDTGCHGYYRENEGVELSRLAGIGGPAPVHQTFGDPLLYLISVADNTVELTALWREASANGTWTDAHTQAAAQRKATLGRYGRGRA
jgi:hypothetical protein